MSENTKQQKDELLDELQSIKEILNDKNTEIPILDDIIAPTSDNTDMATKDMTEKRTTEILSPTPIANNDTETTNTEIPTSTNDFLNDQSTLNASIKELKSATDSLLHNTVPQTPNTTVNFEAGYTLNNEYTEQYQEQTEMKNKPENINPFLPKRILRNIGTFPLTDCSPTRDKTISTTASETQNKHDEIIDELVKQFLPQIEEQLREKLRERLDKLDKNY